MDTYTILILIVAMVIGGITSFVFFGKRKIIDFEKKKEESVRIIEESKKEGNEILQKTKGNVEAFKKRGEDERTRIKRHVEKMEAAEKRKEDYIKKQENRNREIESKITEIEKHTQQIHQKSISLEKEVVIKMADKIGTTIEKEKQNLLENLKKQQRIEQQDKLNQYEESLRENSEKIARELLKETMQRLAAPTSVEKKGAEIKISKDHIKAKIVGKNAENVTMIEEELNVNVIFNDLPNTITVSCYNLVNQHIAAKTIEILVKYNGEITKETIKKAIREARKTTEAELEKIGKEIADKLRLKNKSKKLYELIGRLKFRTSYGQNILKHSLEVGAVAMMLGSELGLNVEVCKVAGFLHDLGKAIDQNPNVQGSHDFLTKELMEELGFSSEEVHAAWTHHESEPPLTPEAKVVMAADAVSAGRPGARQETLDKYLERLQALEEMANSFHGVQKSFAISAGREVRIIVSPEQVDDIGVKNMAEEIAKTVEAKLSYPGKIKINVIRRVKAIDTAK